MTENQKIRWITALRSGDYKQCIAYLRRDGGHCCLGVAEDALFLKREKAYVGFIGESFLPEEIQWGLSSMNDAGVPFEVIAGFIQENIEPT